MGKKPPQQQQDELSWAKLRFFLLQEIGQKFSLSVLWLPMALMPTQACPIVFSYVSFEDGGSI